MTSKKIKVLHIITKMAIGGATENTLLTTSMVDKKLFESSILSGKKCDGDETIFEDIEKRGVRITFLPELVRKINPFQEIVSLFKMVAFIRAGNYDIVHTHSSKAGIIGRIASRICKVPVIIHTIHGWSFNDRMHGFQRALFIRLERFTGRFTDGLIAVTSEDIRKGLKNNIGKKDMYTVIRSGIELQKFVPLEDPERSEMRRRLGISINELVVGTVGRFSKQKDPETFLRMASIVAGRMPDVKFVMVGDGEKKSTVQKMINNLKLDERVLLLGVRKNVNKILPIFDLFVLTSLWEGLPRVVIEAMSVGKPVVATAVDGTVEVVRDGITGFLTPPGDPSRIAERVITALKDGELRKKMGEKGKAAVNPFDARTMVSDIENLYKDLLSPREQQTSTSRTFPA